MSDSTDYSADLQMERPGSQRTHADLQLQQEGHGAAFSMSMVVNHFSELFLACSRAKYILADNATDRVVGASQRILDTAGFSSYVIRRTGERYV